MRTAPFTLRQLECFVATLDVPIIPEQAVPTQMCSFEVVQRGYRLGDRVVRPARVIVSSEPVEV